MVHILLLEKARVLDMGMQHLLQQDSATWVNFNLTAAVRRLKDLRILRLMVIIQTVRFSELDLTLALQEDVQPLLLLSYSTPRLVSHGSIELNLLTSIYKYKTHYINALSSMDIFSAKPR